METPVDQDEEPRVTFFPPLYLQRQAWILEVLRKEKPVSVLDIGCGEAAIISCILNPASSLELRDPELSYLHDSYDIHICKVAGVDVDTDSLSWAMQNSSFPEHEYCDTSPHIHATWLRQPPPRWESLELELWHGGLETFNPQFVYNASTSAGYECIVSTEVIEHLPPHILPFFAYNLLGKYRPRILAVTTPNYSYNLRFREISKDVDSGGFPDPTGRTTRIFRHHDHKFEWTTDEFTEWCHTEANNYGYDVSISGLGRCKEGGDEGLGYASLCAVFRTNGRLPKATKYPATDPKLMTEHAPLFHKVYKAHAASDAPQSRNEILNLLKSLFRHYNMRQLSIQELWVNINLSIVCGGRIENIVNAIQFGADESDKWQLILRGNTREKVVLEWGAMEPIEVWDREDETDGTKLEDDDRSHMSESDSWEGSMDIVSGVWEPSAVPEAWGCNENDSAWAKWGSNAIVDTVESGNHSWDAEL